MAETVDVLLRARMEASEVTSSIGQIQKALQGLTLPKGITNDLEKDFNKLGPLLKDYQRQLNKGFSSKKDLQNFSALKEQIGDTFGSIKNLVNQANSQTIKLKVDTQALDQLQHKITSKTEALEKAYSQVFTKSINSANITDQFNKILQASTKAPTIKGMIGSAQNLFDTKDYAGYNTELDKIKSKILSLKTTKINLAESLGVKNAEKDLSAAEQKITSFFNKLKVNENKVQAIELLKKELKDLGMEAQGLDLASKIKGEEEINNIASSLDQVQQGFRETGDAASTAASGILSMQDQVGQLRQSTQYFFSLRNMINLFKRGIDDAVKSIKELDAAMTETAVVTNFSVGEMWNKLPEYTANANALGATVQDMYEATTLYYQQGLNAEQAMGVATETMKMARIGGLEAADATDKMTAALRGFNMEINEASAQRVNDVYSNLAAKTASNTEELGTAMQRTASIAHSAGMSFEGTAAFLAQAIETTREPAENLGTAMKTIVARFQELKKNPLEIAEVDGEEVSYNKVDTALQSIGVSLKNANGQFRDLDKVFLEISQKWDSLTQTQQRYIATTAAGSRQQSRFIAMMSDYERTMQLMGYANDSAGASQEQFEKTMDSMEAKLNKLHNAWQAFAMGIANNTFVKGAVDGLTFLIDGVNNLIDKLSGGSKTIKSFLSLFTAFTALKGLGRLANAAIGGLGGILDPQSSFKQGFFGGFIGNKSANVASQARMISDPIVNAINRLYQAQTGKTVTTDSQTNAKADYKAFSKANTNLRDFLGKGNLKVGDSFSIGEAYGKINKLDNQQQNAILQQLPGLTLSLQKGGIQFNTKDISKSSQNLLKTFNEEINDGLAKKTLSTQTAMQLLGSPDEFRKALSMRGDDYAEAASEVLYKGFDAAAYKEGVLKELRQTPALSNITDEELESRAQEQVKAKANQVAEENLRKFATGTKVAGADTADSIANIGTVAIRAGQGVAQLGMQLAQLGMTNVGAVITDIGYKISSLGMIASSTGDIIGKLIKAGEGSLGTGLLNVVKAHPMVAAITAMTVAATTAIAIFHKLKQDAKDAAEEVQKNYNDTIKEANERIDSLESNKDAFARLSKGVDEYGHNIGLTTEEYEEYLSISKSLAETSPSLIRGYDAEGRAIVANGKAIDELIKKQKDLQETARQNYTNAGALDTTIEGIRAGENYDLVGHMGNLSKADLAGKSSYNLPFFNKQVKTLEKSLNKLSSKQVRQLNKEISQLTGQKIDLGNLTKDGVRTLATNYSDINRIVEENGKNLNDKTRENIQKAFTGLGEDYNTFTEDLQPLTNQISAYLDSKGMGALGLGISEEFTGGFNKGLENLVMDATLENWGGARLQREAENYANQFKTLTKDGGAYSRTLEQIDRLQQDYLQHMDEDGSIESYNSSIQTQVDSLNALANQYENSGAAGKAFAEMCRQAAADAQNFTEYGVASLAEGLNTLSGEFSYARGAEERFKEAIKGGDYYTAAEQYKSIIDTVMDDKNNAGQGSLTAWRGATELLGANYVDNAKDWNEVAKQVDRITPMFEDGADGVLAFNDYLVEAWETAGNGGEVLSKLGKVVDGEFGKDFEFNFANINDNLREFADELGVSEGALAALIDKSRQWVPWDISDPSMIMSALRTSETSMQGTGGKLYTSESSFRDEAYAHEVVGDNYKTTKEHLEKEQNVEFLTVDKLVSKDKSGETYANNVLKDLGISSENQNNTLKNAVQAYSKLGFGLEDIQKVLTSDGIALQESNITAEDVEEAYNEQQFAQENPTVAGIANDTGVIASNTAAMLTAMGILSKEAEKNIEQATDSKHLRDVEDTFKTDVRKAQTTKDHENARNKVQMEIEGIDSSIALLEKGKEQLTEGSAEYNKYVGYIEELNNARERLQKTLDDDNKSFEAKKKAIEESLAETGANSSDQEFINANALEFDAALNNTDLQAGIASLRALREEGDLSHQSLFNLAQQFQALHDTDLSNLTYGELSSLYTSLGLASSESKSLYMSLHGLSEEQTEILVNTKISGTDKVNEFIDTLAETPEQKTIMIEAAAKVANGDSTSAKESLMKQLGLSEDKAEKITQQIEIAIETGSINGADITSVLNSLPDEKNITFTGDASGVIGAASEASSSVEGVPVKTNTNFQGNPSKVIGAANTSKGAIAGIPTSHMTLVQGNPAGAVGASNTASSSIRSIPTSHHTTISATDNASSKANAVIGALSSIPRYISTTIETIKKTTTRPSARGRNFSIPAHKTPTFGSAARGFNTTRQSKREVVGLVGEEGFEVAYIPSEGRSMILGLNGPEFASFPNDTVIYPHKQSLDIIRRGKQHTPTMEAFASGRSGGLRSSTIKYQQGSGSSSSSSGSRSGSKKSSSKGKGSDKSDKKADLVTQKAGTVIVWWENITRRADAITRKVDASAKKVDKLLQAGGVTLKSFKSTSDTYKKNLNAQIDIYKLQKARATDELKILETGKNYRGKENKFYREAEISYEVTKKKDGKESKETKKQTVNLANFITRDKATNTLQISQAAINKIAGGYRDKNGKWVSGNKSKAEAIKQAAEKEINDRTSKLWKAEDAIQKAQEALDKLNDDVYKTFYQWEKSINKVYVLTQKLEKLEKRANIFDAKNELVYAELTAGRGQNSNRTAAVSDLKYNAARERSNLIDTVKNQRALLSAARGEYNTAKDLETYRRKFNANKNSAEAKLDWKGAQEAIKLFNKYNGDYEAALKELNGKGYNEATYNKVKDVLDNINEKQGALLDATEATYQAVTKLYDRIEEDQETIADFENELLDAIIEQAEKRIDRIEKLNSSLSNAFKKLIDEVKKTLDERRRQEDNQKTETDIAKKQQRLAALRASTGGGNAVEIARLEQEIASDRQSYGRTIEDQMLDKLSQQNDLATQQREEQINLLQGQHEIAKATGVYVKQVATWMSNPNKYMSQIRDAWLTQQGYDTATKQNRAQLEQNFNKTIVQVQVAIADLKASIDALGTSSANWTENYADIQAGLGANEIKTLVNSKGKALFDAKTFKNAGYGAKTLLQSGIYTAKDLKNAGYTARQLKDTGLVSVAQMKKAGFSATQMRQAGYSAAQLKKSYSAKQIKQAGYSASQFKAAQFTAEQAKAAGYKGTEIAKAYGAGAALRAGVSGKDIQAGTGISAAIIQKSVNANIKNKNVKQSDMAGVRTNIDINGKKKGGVVSGTITAGGNYVYANGGSTLYGQAWNAKTGKATGKVSKVSIGNLTTQHFKGNKKEATEALVYAITHQTWGSKINKNFKALVKSAGISGKQYKLAGKGHNWFASVGGDGIIYQNQANGVGQWNPATGKATLSKYNKANFLKVAKRNNGPSREYAQVLINKKAYTKAQLQKLGVKQFETGGLADFTGPAWLDGTSSKPELVLNAQDTKNFLMLKDVLSRAMSSTNSIENSYGGDANFEININVDHINNDYDVDKITERIKRNILKDSSYRNVTQVRKFR